MSENPIALTHVYWYSPEDPNLPDLIGRANATAAGLLYDQGKVSRIFSSARTLEPHKPPLSDTIARQVKLSFPQIPESSIVTGAQRAATTYGEIRDFRNYLVGNGKTDSPTADIAAKLHQSQMSEFYRRFFPGQEINYFSFEDTLKSSPRPEDRDLISEVEASPDYQKLNAYLEKIGPVYWISKNFPVINDLLEFGPIPLWKVYLQKKVIGKS